MIEKFGDVFGQYNQDDNLLITTNAVVTVSGKLVMGAGAALQAREKFKGIDKVFGQYVQLHSSDGVTHCLYGCVPKLFHNIGMFQTKYHYGNKSPVDLIEFSTNMLNDYAERNPNEIFNLNYPGINHGGLTIGQVYPIIRYLPDNVFVWRYKP